MFVPMAELEDALITAERQVLILEEQRFRIGTLLEESNRVPHGDPARGVEPWYPFLLLSSIRRIGRGVA